MIRTDGRPTIAMRESEPQIPGQMTVEDCIEVTLQEVMDEWEKEQRAAEPVYGGF